MKKLLLVCGMYRSGTSALTQTLSELGYYAGAAQDLTHADEFNRDGYWENAQIMRFNHSLTAQYGLLDFVSEPLPSDWRDYPVSEPFLRLGTDLVQKLYGDRQFAGWKDPRTARLAPFTLELLQRLGVEGQFVAPIRHPSAVAASMVRRDFLEEGAAIGLWVHGTLSALHFFAPGSFLLIDHAKLMADPRGALTPLFGRFGYAEPTEEAWTRAIQCIQSGLLTQRPDDGPPLPAFAQRVHRLVNAILSDDAAYAAGSFQLEIDELYQEWSEWLQTLAPRRTPPAVVSITGLKTTGTRIAACRWGEVSLEVDAPPGSPLFLNVSGPGIAYLRNPRLISGTQVLPFQATLGPDCHGEMTGPQEWRLVIYTGGKHLVIRAPQERGPWRFESEIFAQTGTGFTHAAYQALLERSRRS